MGAGRRRRDVGGRGCDGERRVGQGVAGGSVCDAVALSAGFWYAGFGPTSVHPALFEAVPLGAAILVTWETSQEIDNLGFNLYRAASERADGAAERDAYPDASAARLALWGGYEWLDEDGLAPGITYYCWLENVDLHGQRCMDRCMRRPWERRRSTCRWS